MGEVRRANLHSRLYPAEMRDPVLRRALETLEADGILELEPATATSLGGYWLKFDPEYDDPEYNESAGLEANEYDPLSGG